MNYILVVALILFVVASIVAVYYYSQLADLQKHYNLQEHFLQSAKKIADGAIKEAMEEKRKADVFQQVIRGLEEKHESFMQLQKQQLTAEFELKAQAIRRDAIQRAKVVNKGFDGETFSPFLIQGWSAKDFRHIGDPVDYMIFLGAEDVRSNLQDELDGIVILEVKTGNSDLNKVQRRIRDAVVNGYVEFALYNVDDKTIRIWSQTDPKGKDVRQQS